MAPIRSGLLSATALALFALTGCATVASERATFVSAETPIAANFEQDRASILAMAGDYKVSFDFTETVSFLAGYELKEPKLSGGHESVRVIEDRGDFISLQHLLVVGPDEAPFVVKHWRQDWQYEPARVLTFVGGNAWAWRDVPVSERAGTWSQTVYQVDDAPRYGRGRHLDLRRRNCRVDPASGMAPSSPPRHDHAGRLPCDRCDQSACDYALGVGARAG